MSEYSLTTEGIDLKKTMIFILAVLTALAGGCSEAEPMMLSGTIEAEEVAIVAEVGGMVQEVKAEEGDVLTKGQVMAVIDKRHYEFGVAEAEAVLAQASARLEEARAGSRDQTVQKGIAAVQQANAQISLAEARVQQAQANLARTREQVVQAESQLAGARQTLAYQEERLQEMRQLYENGAVSKKDFETQQEAVNQARTMVNQLQAQAAASRSQVAGMQEELEAAAAQSDTAKAQRQSAAAELDLLQEGHTDAYIKQLLAGEKQARARLEMARLQLEKATVTAPEEGVVLRKNIAAGEVAKAGANLFTMMRKDQLKVKVYVPEADLGQVGTGQEVAIQVDAYPGETFAGVIRTIADQAEFTPKNVQTKDERTKLVFAVTIQITSGLDKLKPGMPADVLLDGAVSQP